MTSMTLPPARSPTWRSPRFYPLRLLRAPALRLRSRSERRSTFAIDGLVCGLCAARTQGALAEVAGVQRVRVHLSAGVVELEHEALVAGPELSALSRALDGAVIARGARSAVARILTPLRRAAR